MSKKFMNLFWGKLNLQDSLNIFSEYLNLFHDLNLLILSILITFIFMFMTNLIINKYFKMYFLELEFIEIIWTIIPCMILILLGWPSMQLLYNLENSSNFNSMTLKIIGHQWYWSYSFSNFLNMEFDSFMVLEDELMNGNLRLMEVDNSVILPLNSNTRLLTISSDVLHSWAMPSMGLKMDANPGRLNQIYLLSSMPGKFYGQCSELCGVNHSFMPIKLEFVNIKMFKEWMKVMSNVLSKMY